MDRLDIEIKLYHDLYALGRTYGLNDETATTEALMALKLFNKEATGELPDIEVAVMIAEEFAEYIKNW